MKDFLNANPQADTKAVNQAWQAAGFEGLPPPTSPVRGDPIGLTAEAEGFAHPNHGLTTVVTGHGLRYPVEIRENSRKTLFLIMSIIKNQGKREPNRLHPLPIISGFQYEVAQVSLGWERVETQEI